MGCAKSRLAPDYQQSHHRDFNVGYVVTIILALMFMALGALVQYGKPLEPLSGGKFIIRTDGFKNRF